MKKYIIIIASIILVISCVAIYKLNEPEKVSDQSVMSLQNSWQTKAKQYIKNKQYDKAADFLESLLLDIEKTNPNQKYYPQAILLLEVYYIQSKNIINSKSIDEAQKLQGKLQKFSRFGKGYLYLVYIYASQAKAFQLLNDITRSNEICHIGLKKLKKHEKTDGSEKVKMRLLWVLAQNYYKSNDLPDAIKTGDEAFSILERIENTPSMRKSAEELLDKWRKESKSHCK